MASSVIGVRFREASTDQAWQVQQLMNTLLIQLTVDGEEGREAFNEKRTPNFTGRLRQRGEPFPEPDAEQAERLNAIYRSEHF